ncbi:MAG TPA: hypothetical protein P5137_00745 [Candidatus Brocadiia bacterium]|nr:hypothetical protein [Candidatus Brocadiia bacterium]
MKRDILQVVFVAMVVAVGVGYAFLFRETAILQTRLQALEDQVKNFDRRLQARQSDEEMIRALMTRIGHFTQLCQGRVTEATRRMVASALTERQDQASAPAPLSAQLVDMLKARDLEEFASMAGLNDTQKQALAQAGQRFRQDVLAALDGMGGNVSAEACKPVFEAASRKRLDEVAKALSKGQFVLFCLYYNVAPPPPAAPAAPGAMPEAPKETDGK